MADSGLFFVSPDCVGSDLDGLLADPVEVEGGGFEAVSTSSESLSARSPLPASIVDKFIPSSTPRHVIILGSLMFL